MKLFIGIVISVFVLGVAGYFTFPFLLEKKTGGLQTEIQALKKRIEKTEAYIDKEEKAVRESKVNTNANLPQVIKTVNSLSAKVSSLENDLNKGLSKNEDFTKKQNALLEASIKKQQEFLEKGKKDQQENTQKILFEIGIARIKEHLLKFKENILGRNVGLAKDELDALSINIEKLLVLTPAENKKAMGEFQELVKKVKTDIDSDLPAALSRIDLLWHEMDKLFRK
jgi:hypothetical protein